MRISDWSSDVCSSDLLISRPHVKGLDVILVLVEQAYRLGQRIAPEWIAQLARAHDLDDSSFAVIHLQVNRFLERGAYIFQFVDHDAFGAHGFGDSGEALVVELSGDEAAIVKINLVFLFRAPLAIVEDPRGNRNIVEYAGHGFHQAPAPGEIGRASGWERSGQKGENTEG